MKIIKFNEKKLITKFTNIFYSFLLFFIAFKQDVHGHLSSQKIHLKNLQQMDLPLKSTINLVFQLPYLNLNHLNRTKQKQCIPYEVEIKMKPSEDFIPKRFPFTEEDYLRLDKYHLEHFYNVKKDLPYVKLETLSRREKLVYFESPHKPLRSPDLGKTIKMTTYNTLYQGFIKNNHFDQWDNFDFNLLHPRRRALAFSQTMKNLQSDIICAQELSEDFYVTFLKKNPEYSGVFTMGINPKMKTKNKSTQGVAIFFKKSHFNPLDVKTIETETFPKSHGKFMLGLNLKRNNKTININCAHFPIPSKSNTTKDLHKFLTFSQRFSYNPHDKIFLGDFNLNQTYLKKSILQQRYKKLNLLTPPQGHGRVNTKGSQKIDHILFNTSGNLKLRESPDVQKGLKNKINFLSHKNPSDHIPYSALIKNW